MFTFVNEKFSQILCIDSVVNIVVINLGKVGQTNTQFLGFRLVSMTSFTSLDITDNPSRVFVHRSRVARNQTRREGGGGEGEGKKKKKQSRNERSMRKNVCGFVSQTRQCRRSSKSDRGDRGMKFNWFRICTAYRRPMTSRPNMVTKVIVRYASHWKRNCKLKSQRHEKDTSVERKKKKKNFLRKFFGCSIDSSVLVPCSEER